MNGELWVRPTADGVALTKIFDWYEGDFSSNGVIAFINRYREEDKIDGDAKISYLPYDWSLNRVE